MAQNESFYMNFQYVKNSIMTFLHSHDELILNV